MILQQNDTMQWWNRVPFPKFLKQHHPLREYPRPYIHHLVFHIFK